jgi:manganese/iron transport system substrate-binding protein
MFARSALAALALCLAVLPAAAQEERLKVVTTFTVIWPIWRSNVAGEAADVVSITRPERRDPRITSRRRAIMLRAQDADLSSCGTGSTSSSGSSSFLSRSLRDVPGVVVSEGVEPMGIGGWPI